MTEATDLPEATTPETTANQKKAARSNSSPSGTTKTQETASKPHSAAPVKKMDKSQAHFILQGKGGVGKSLVSSLLAQFLIENGYPVRGIDTDPINQTFANLPYIDGEAATVTDTQSNETNHKVIDGIMGEVLDRPAAYVVDNGASSFIPMSVYLIDGGGLVTLAEEGVSPVIHLVIPVGPETDMALEGCLSLIESVAGQIPVILWINEREDSWERYFGTAFEDNALYKELESGIAGVVTIPHMKAPTSLNFADMLRQKQSFADVAASDKWLFMERSRLKRVKEEIFSSIGMALQGVE